MSKLSSDRLSSLEQALPLAEHFFETHLGISDWLDETEAETLRLDMPALRPDQVQRQLDRNKQLLQSVQEHRPLIDKLNKTGGALARLCNDEEAQKVSAHLETPEIPDTQRAPPRSEGTLAWAAVLFRCCPINV